MKFIVSKISLLGCCLASSMAFAGGNTLYGDFRYSLNNVDSGSVSTLSTQSNASRIGLKGGSEAMDGISVFYHLQAGASIDTNANGDAITQRFHFAGIKGEFGKVMYGRTSTPYKMAGLKIDPFYDTSAGLGAGGATYGLSGLTNGWTDNSLAYSRKINNFGINAGIYLDDAATDEHDFNIGISHSDGALSGGLQYLMIGSTGIVAKSTADSSALRIHAKYKMSDLTLGGSVETVDPDAGAKQTYVYLAATTQMSDKLSLSASYGSVDGLSSLLDGDAITLGAFCKLLKKTTVYALYSMVSAGTDRDTLSFGVSHKFAIK